MAGRRPFLSGVSVCLPLQVSDVHKQQCSSLAVSEDGRFLLTAGHKAVKVWDYAMRLDVNSQVSAAILSLRVTVSWACDLCQKKQSSCFANRVRINK